VFLGNPTFWRAVLYPAAALTCPLVMAIS